jgi:hypothetical protein
MSDMSFIDFLEHAGVQMSDGSFVSAKAVRLVEIVRDYDRNLEVEWVPRERRLPGDDAIRIVDTTRHGFARIVMSFRDEDEFTARDGALTLERLFLADGTKGNVMARVEAQNAAAKLIELKKTLELREEGLDVARHALASPLNDYRFRDPAGQLMVIKDGRPDALPAPAPKVFG